MKKRNQVALGLCMVVACLLFLLFDYLGLSDRDRLVVDNFDEVSIGMPRAKVELLLGKPDSVSPRFYLGQRSGYEDAYRRAETSNCTVYLVWVVKYLKSITYVVGFDETGVARVAESGGT